jgi:DNA helicase-2/ATP-dependent DNA helicase PcrA
VALGDGLTLNGQIDKLEIGPDGRSVCAVDYKTGRPKSRQHILGGLKAAGSGDYFRQLVFYKLLLDKFEAGEYRVEAGLLDFIEPDEKGRYHQEKFELTDAHVSDLKNQIKAVVAEILNLEFFRRGCEKPDCEFCRLYNLTNG